MVIYIRRYPFRLFLIYIYMYIYMYIYIFGLLGIYIFIYVYILIVLPAPPFISCRQRSGFGLAFGGVAGFWR